MPEAKREPMKTVSRADYLAVTFALVFPTIITVAYFILAAGYPAIIQQTTYSLGKLLQFTFPLVWVCAIQRHKPCWTKPAANDLGLGTAFGLLVGAVIVGGYFFVLKPAGTLGVASAAMQEKLAGAGIEGVVPFVALGVFYSLGHALLEEYYWRWFTFGQLRRLAPLGVAIFVSSAGFMAHHVLVLAWYFGWFTLVTILFSLSVAVGGAVWAWMYQRSGSLWGVWLSHLLVDAAIFIVGYDLVFGASGAP